MTYNPVGTEKEYFEKEEYFRSVFNLIYEENSNNKNNNVVGFDIIKNNSSGLIYTT